MLNTEYINSNNQIERGDFSDPRVILVRPNDSRLAIWRPDSECHYEQGFDSPTYVAVGKGATDEQLAKVSARYGVPLEDLRAFREGVNHG